MLVSDRRNAVVTGYRAPRDLANSQRALLEYKSSLGKEATAAKKPPPPCAPCSHTTLQNEFDGQRRTSICLYLLYSRHKSRRTELRVDQAGESSHSPLAIPRLSAKGVDRPNRNMLHNSLAVDIVGRMLTSDSNETALRSVSLSAPAVIFTDFLTWPEKKSTKVWHQVWHGSAGSKYFMNTNH